MQSNGAEQYQNYGERFFKNLLTQKQQVVENQNDMAHSNGNFADEALLDQIRAILLREDRSALARLEHLLDTPDELAEKVAPIIEPKLEFLKNNFPEKYKSVVDKLIEERIRNSQEQIVEAIYPLLGSMVRKFIEHQFQLLKESIEERLAEMRRRMNVWRRIRAWFGGVSEAEILMAASQPPSVEEVFLIERDSGILMAYAAKSKNLDPESVAGMFTAIKSFVQDAFQREEEELDFIAYSHYKILVENYRAYFVAAVVEGSVSAAERNLLAQKLQKFIIEEFHAAKNDPEKITFERVSGLLDEQFIREATVIKT